MTDYRGRRTLGDSRPLPSMAGWSGPPDPPEDNRVFECQGCGREYAKGGWQVAHSFELCPGSPSTRRDATSG